MLCFVLLLSKACLFNLHSLNLNQPLPNLLYASRPGLKTFGGLSENVFA